jgi:hypothetical protein
MAIRGADRVREAYRAAPVKSNVRPNDLRLREETTPIVGPRRAAGPTTGLFRET